MKLHDDDIAAARKVFDEYGHTGVYTAAIGHAILAALTVRKARKAKRRDEKLPSAKDVRGIMASAPAPEKNAQVQESLRGAPITQDDIEWAERELAELDRASLTVSPLEPDEFTGVAG